MFQNLKNRIATEASRANQAILSTVLQTDNKPSSRDSGIRTPSISSRDENNDTNRSRLSSASSDISQITNYISPTAQYPPPSDIEIEQTGDESDYETNNTQKFRKSFVELRNKFLQLKKSYDEIDRERTRVKELLQKQQDISFKQREKLKYLQQEKEQSELALVNELQVRETQVEELNQQLKRKNESEQEENRNLREKINKLEGSISKFQEKQVNLIIERDQVLQQLRDIKSTPSSEINLEPLNQEIVELKNKCEAFDSLKTEYRTLISESAQLKQDKEQTELSLQNELKIRNEQIEELHQQLRRKNESELEENRNLREKINKLEGSISKFQEKQASLITERDQALQSDINVQPLREEIIELKTKCEGFDNLKTEYAALVNGSTQLKQEKEQLEELNQQLKRKNKSDEEEIQSLREKLNKLDQPRESDIDVESLQQEIIELKNKCEGFDNLKTEYTALVNESTQLTQEKEQLEELNQQLTRKTESVETEIRNLREKNNELDQFRQSNIDIESLREEITELKTKCEDFDNLKTQYKALVSESSKLKQEKEQLEELNQQLKRKTESEEEEIRNLREKINEHDQTVQSDIDNLKSEIVALVKINEENTRQIDEYAEEKFNFEQEITDKDRQITERDEKIQDLELTIKQTQESSVKLRKALQKMKDSTKDIDEYEQRLKDQEIEYDTKLKSLAKEMDSQIQENQRKYQEELDKYIKTNVQSDNETIRNAEQKIADAEKRASTAENHLFKLEEELKVKQLDHYEVVRDLQIETEKLKKQLASYQIVTNEHSCQTDLTESVEIDYLKRVFQGYLIGTDRVTMARVICAVLKYTDEETSTIVEQEKLRQSRWLNSSK